jgi:rfaE bifunctional protein kinase chain/domain
MEYPEMFDKFEGIKFLIVGDLMLDKFVYGDVSRISPEAPVQVIRVMGEEETLGGSGNVAKNVASLGGKVFASGIVGDDFAGKKIEKLFSEEGIDSSGVICENERETIQKVRIVGQSQHLIRVDYEKILSPSEETEKKMIEYFEETIPQVDVIIISDYAKGTISKKSAERLVDLAKAEEKIILVDTKPSNADFYRNVSLVKPNLKEALEMSGCPDIENAGEHLVKMFNSDILITQGNLGMALFGPSQERIHFPAKAREVFDVSGAGDTVISVIGLVLGAGGNLQEAVELANIAAGLVVEKKGVVSPDKAEILRAISTKVVPKVWGEEKWIVNVGDYCGKRLFLRKGYRCSLHSHKIKDETFYVTKGKVLLEFKDGERVLLPGDSQRIFPGDLHRFTGLENSEIMEFSTHHDDEDSYRVEPSGKDPRN